eukprot:5561190-Pyramimonas_sp.AAC.1
MAEAGSMRGEVAEFHRLLLSGAAAPDDKSRAAFEAHAALTQEIQKVMSSAEFWAEVRAKGIQEASARLIETAAVHEALIQCHKTMPPLLGRP